MFNFNFSFVQNGKVVGTREIVTTLEKGFVLADGAWQWTSWGGKRVATVMVSGLVKRCVITPAILSELQGKAVDSEYQYCKENRE